MVFFSLYLSPLLSFAVFVLLVIGFDFIVFVGVLGFSVVGRCVVVIVSVVI